jgi:RNA polymerase sigma-70 factor (ECF subfamily)
VSNAGTTDHAAGGPPADGRSDEELLVLSREGDRQAFRLLLERHRDDLLRYLVRFLGSRAAADDVFQETFIQVHLAADTFDPERRFRPWLYAIASNKARDHHRRGKRRAAASLNTPLATAGERSLADFLETTEDSPDRPASDEEMRLAVKRVVDEMPAHYREILLLAYFHRMSYQQIAEVLGIPLGTVKSRLHAAVAHFAASWKLAPEGRSTDE